MWDPKKDKYAPKTKCQTQAYLQKYQKKGQLLLHCCGSCEDTNFFEGYFELPSSSPSTQDELLETTTTKMSVKKSQKLRH